MLNLHDNNNSVDLIFYSDLIKATLLYIIIFLAVISIEESYSFTQHESKTTVQLESEMEKRLVSQECSVSDSMSESSGAIAIKVKFLFVRENLNLNFLFYK